LAAGRPNPRFAGNSEITGPKNHNFPRELPRDFPREEASEPSSRAPSSAPRERFTAQTPCKSGVNYPPSSGGGEPSDPENNKIARNFEPRVEVGKKGSLRSLGSPTGKPTGEKRARGFPGDRGRYLRLRDPERQG
jgi:hypothetical protein